MAGQGTWARLLAGHMMMWLKKTSGLITNLQIGPFTTYSKAILSVFDYRG